MHAAGMCALEWRGDVGACSGHVCIGVSTRVVKDKKRQSSSIIPIVLTVETIMTSNFWGEAPICVKLCSILAWLVLHLTL